MRDRANITTALLLALTLAFLYLCYLLFKPYAGPILFALVIAIVFHPVHRYSQKRLRNRNAAALVSTLVAVVFTAGPLLYLGLALSHELGGLYNLLAVKSAGNGGPGLYLVRTLQHSVRWLAGHSPFPAIDVRGMIVRQVEVASASLVAIGAGFLRNLLLLTVNAVIGCFVLFFLFRDGEMLLRRLSLMLPLGPGRFAELQHRISTTVVANFYGGIAVGAAQGTLTALAFWALGIDAPVVWAACYRPCTEGPHPVGAWRGGDWLGRQCNPSLDRQRKRAPAYGLCFLCAARWSSGFRRDGPVPGPGDSLDYSGSPRDAPGRSQASRTRRRADLNLSLYRHRKAGKRKGRVSPGSFCPAANQPASRR
jgi:AI-2E family transporter